ncbi:MAG: hypothetical protein ACJ73S_14850 [Mycobacteriales bacterium]
MRRYDQRAGRPSTSRGASTTATGPPHRQLGVESDARTERSPALSYAQLVRLGGQFTLGDRSRRRVSGAR